MACHPEDFVLRWRIIAIDRRHRVKFEGRGGKIGVKEKFGRNLRELIRSYPHEVSYVRFTVPQARVYVSSRSRFNDPRPFLLVWEVFGEKKTITNTWLVTPPIVSRRPHSRVTTFPAYNLLTRTIYIRVF